MKHEDFSNLVASIKQAGQIRRGEMPPSRSFELQPDDISLHVSKKAFRANLKPVTKHFDMRNS